MSESRLDLSPILGNDAEVHEMERRIKMAYATALRHVHEGGSIQIHAGADVVDYLKSLVTHPRHPLLNTLVRPTAFGHPVIPADENLGGDHLSIHVVHYVY